MDTESGVSGQSHGNGPAALDTSSVGAHSLVVNAIDGAGNAASAGCDYQVVYAVTGFLPPVANAPAVNAVKFGRTVPVKWQLRDANAMYVTDLNAVSSIRFAPVGGFGTLPDTDIDLPVAGPSGLRDDLAANQFVFAWKTDAVACGGSCVLAVRLLDGTELIANFTLK